MLNTTSNFKPELIQASVCDLLGLDVHEWSCLLLLGFNPEALHGQLLELWFQWTPNSHTGNLLHKKDMHLMWVKWQIGQYMAAATQLPA